MESKSRADNYLTDKQSIEKRTILFYKYVYPYKNLIFHICIKHTASYENVRDNYNEVLVNFYKYVDTYDTSKSIKTWIYAVTVRLVYDLETKRRRFQRTGDVGDTPVEQIISDELLEEDGICANAMTLDNYRELYSDEVLHALDQIKLMYREPFLLQVAGYTLEEITKILHRKGGMKNANIETTKSRIFLAKKKLRELLTRDGKRKED
ncbi:RNA polymerase sigma factor [Bacteroides uniformis]|uniref:RNA polymerase sigma factor n=1 Tax=Bacteroides uniformis TaxID=820 RepID=UPI00233E9BAD|nr:RNA polymerase sigma factor [Bacteroides uniformis]MDC1812110.1 RNA polymerase sigma factor [Bacteroides uniformis]